MSQARVILRKSLIGCTKQQKAAAYCLGLRKPGQIVMLDLNPVNGRAD